VLLHGDEQPPDTAAMIDDLGSTWLLPDTTYKPYSCGAWNHSSMDAVLTIMRAQSLRHGDLARIDVTVPAECLPIVCEPRDVKIHPGSPYHMKFSLPYSVAILAVRGSAGVDDFSEDVFADPVVAELAGRVYCVADPAMAPQRFPARVAVQTNDGRRFEHDVPAQRGGPGNRSTAADHRAKFQANAEPTLGAEGTSELAETIENIWGEPSVDRIAALLKRKAG
jgi:2-methylcitrate dehydratase PrpD